MSTEAVREEYEKAKKAYEIANKTLDSNLERAANAERADRRQYLLNYSFKMYHPASHRYLKALEAYAKAHPEKRELLLDEYISRAWDARMRGKWSGERQHFKSAKELSVQLVVAAHKKVAAHQHRVGMRFDKDLNILLALLEDARVLTTNDPKVENILSWLSKGVQEGEITLQPVPRHLPLTFRVHEYRPVGH